MTGKTDDLGVDGLLDTKALAARLGVSPATVRSWRLRGVPWLPAPVGRLDGLVWREEDVAVLDDTVPLSPGRPSEAQRRTRSDRFIDAAARKNRGAFYTRHDAAHFMAEWIVRHESETYLEPSFGDGAFIEAVNDVVARAGWRRPNWQAVELDGGAAGQAVTRGLLHSREVSVGDYLDHADASVDAVIANPPYVRLRGLESAERNKALTVAASHLGQEMAESGSLWMPFTAKMVSAVKPGGRMAAVLPFDFTYVRYAAPLWTYLAANFGRLHVIRSRERIFEEINQDVLILLAEERGDSTDAVGFSAFERVDDFGTSRAAVATSIAISDITAGNRVFQRALLPAGLDEVLSEHRRQGRIVAASSVAKFRIGYVAGDKKFFHPDLEAVASFQLPQSSLHPTATNARRLRGIGLFTSDIGDKSAEYLWRPGAVLTEGELAYVHRGEQDGVSAGYKARLRTKWYVVPDVKVPDALLTVFSERPMLLVNDAHLTASNSLLGAYMEQGSAREFATSWYTPLTLLSIGLEVHSLGGGVMVMVPNEAKRVNMLPLRPGACNLAAINSALAAGDVAGAYAAGEAQLTSQIGQVDTDLVIQGIDALTRWRSR